MSTELAKWIVGMREMRGWKQSELADRAGITRQDMNAIEKGRIALPGADKRRKLASALGIRHVDFLVAIGELSPEEVTTVTATPTDTRVSEFIDLLPYVDDVVMGALRRMTLGTNEQAGRVRQTA